MHLETLAWMLALSRNQFENTLSVFNEQDSAWKPDPTSLTVAQQVAHVAQANDWFHHGITQGFDAPYDSSKAGDSREVSQFTSLNDAKKWLDASFSKLSQLLADETVRWEAPFPTKPRFGGQPKWSAFVGLVDHCGHHRGTLQMYARGMGKTNKASLPYH